MIMFLPAYKNKEFYRAVYRKVATKIINISIMIRKCCFFIIVLYALSNGFCLYLKSNSAFSFFIINMPIANIPVNKLLPINNLSSFACKAKEILSMQIKKSNVSVYPK